MIKAGSITAMKRRFSIAMLIALLMSTAAGADRLDQNSFHIVGYLPDYRVERFDPRTAERLTDLVFFSVKPEPNGKFVSAVLDSPKTVAMLKQVRDEYHVKILLCIGGWDRSQGFAEIAATPDARKQFAGGLTEYCRQHGFAGADIDWEHPQNEKQIEDYGLLLAEIAQQFKPHEMQLTVAMAGWQGMSKQAIESVDAFHLMSYDAPQKHSTIESAETDLLKLIKTGVPQSKIRLGVPFYGRGISQPERVKTYAEIVSAVPKSLDRKILNSDEIDGIYFNGPATIRTKTRFAKDSKLNGVMIWEIGQDAAGDDSLLKVIWETAKASK